MVLVIRTTGRNEIYLFEKLLIVAQTLHSCLACNSATIRKAETKESQKGRNRSHKRLVCLASQTHLFYLFPALLKCVID